MKIAILGAGAMGSIYGGFLSQHNEVWFVDVWKAHVDAINEKGLTITENGVDTVFHPKAVTTGAEVGVADLVVVFVKSINTGEALASNGELFGENTLVLSLQNGYGNGDDIAKYVPERNIVLGVTHHGANVLGPGHVQHNGRGYTMVGVKPGNSFANAEKVAALLCEAGFDAKASTDAMRSIWTKLIANAGGNAMTALLGVKNGYMVDCPAIEYLFDAMVREGIQVAKAEGIDFEMDDETMVEQTKVGLRKVAENRSSMLQDVTKKRKTEIERINGAIVAVGKQHGIACPYNDMATHLIQGLEAAYDINEYLN